MVYSSPVGGTFFAHQLRFSPCFRHFGGPAEPHKAPKTPSPWTAFWTAFGNQIPAQLHWTPLQASSANSSSSRACNTIVLREIVQTGENLARSRCFTGFAGYVQNFKLVVNLPSETRLFIVYRILLDQRSMAQADDRASSVSTWVFTSA